MHTTTSRRQRNQVGDWILTGNTSVPRGTQLYELTKGRHLSPGGIRGRLVSFVDMSCHLWTGPVISLVYHSSVHDRTNRSVTRINAGRHRVPAGNRRAADTRRPSSERMGYFAFRRGRCVESQESQALARAGDQPLRCLRLHSRERVVWPRRCRARVAPGVSPGGELISQCRSRVPGRAGSRV
jgi:hypothetical protein